MKVSDPNCVVGHEPKQDLEGQAVQKPPGDKPSTPVRSARTSSADTNSKAIPMKPDRQPTDILPRMINWPMSVNSINERKSLGLARSGSAQAVPLR